MADNWTISQSVDLARPDTIATLWPTPLMVTGDQNAHTWQVTLTQNGAPVDLSGAIVTCYIIRPHRDSAVLVGGEYAVGPSVPGTARGNTLSATFPREAYAYEGNILGLMKYTLPDETRTVTAAMLHASVRAGVPGDVVDPGGVIPTLEELLALIYHMERLVDAYEGVTAAAQALPAHAPATAAVSYVNGVLHFDFGLPKGDSGDGSGDMLKAEYDADNDGVVDDAGRLGGELPGHYMPRPQAAANGHLAMLDANRDAVDSGLVAADIPLVQELGSPELVINGMGAVNVRGAVAQTATAANHYGLDRWAAFSNAASMSQRALSATEQRLTGATHAIRVTCLSSSWNSVFQPFELADMLAGGPVTLTCMARGFGGLTQMGMGAGIYNTAGQSVTVSLTETFAPFSLTIDALAIGDSPWQRGVTFRTPGVTYTDGGYEVTAVSLRPGRRAIPFCRPDPTLERLMCQRYFYKAPSFVAHKFYGSNAYSGISYPVRMRALPTVTVSAHTPGSSTSIEASNVTGYVNGVLYFSLPGMSSTIYTQAVYATLEADAEIY